MIKLKKQKKTEEKVRKVSASFPLRIQKCGAEGWFFISCVGIPGLSAFGPDLEPLFDELKIAGTQLLHDRGVRVIRLEIIAISKSPNPNSWNEADKFELRGGAVSTVY